MVEKKQDFSLISYTLGIVSIIMAIFGDYGLAGIVFGIIGLNLCKNQKTELIKKARKLNLIGIIIGIIFFVLSILAFFLTTKIPLV